MARRPFTIVVLAALVVSAGCRTSSSKAALSADITFRCLWWSQAQMEGLNPNSPPPKTTEVVLRRWEYTDPVGVPHPDVIDVVADLKNLGGEARGLVVEFTSQWRTGPLDAESRAAWGHVVPLYRSEPFQLGHNESRTVRVTVDLAAKMKALEATAAWPWTLRVGLTVRHLGASKTLLTEEVDFPIHPGN